MITFKQNIKKVKFICLFNFNFSYFDVISIKKLRKKF